MRLFFSALLRLVGERLGQVGMLDHDMQAEVLEDMVAVSPADRAADGVVETFDHPTGEAFVEVVEEFVPPVQEGLSKPDQWGDARNSSASYNQARRKRSPRAVVGYCWRSRRSVP